MEQQATKVVLAEDDKFICRAYKDGLTKAGFEVHLAFDGDEAVKKTREVKPAMVLLDIIMPSKNGFEVLEELRMDESLKHIPIIILSNLGQEEDVKKGMQLGAVDYLVKSNCSLKEVIDKIRFHLVSASRTGQPEQEHVKTEPAPDQATS